MDRARWFYRAIETLEGWECHHGGVDGRQGRITGDDALLRTIWDHATDIQLRCPAGVFTIHMSSYVLGRGSVVVAVEGPQPGPTAVLAAA